MGLQQLSQRPLVVLDQEFLNKYSVNTGLGRSSGGQPLPTGQVQTQALMEEHELASEEDGIEIEHDIVEGDIVKPTALGDCAYFTLTASYSFVDAAKDAVIPAQYKPEAPISNNNQ